MKYLKLIGLIILFSCSNTKDYIHCQNILEKTMNVKISDEFLLIEHHRDFAIGDYTEQFKLKLSENDFDIMLKSVDSLALKKIIDTSLYYFNTSNSQGEFISIIFNPIELTVQYSMHSD